MLYRKVEARIKGWLDNSSSALLVSGARQVGKTTIIKECLEKNDVNYVYVNLFEQKDVARMIEKVSPKGAKELVSKFSLLGDNVRKNDTIFFFDEVDECLELVTMIKFLVEENSFRYILSSAVLDTKLASLRSIPVGYLDIIKMYPLDFEEFLYALDVEKDVVSKLYECYRRVEAVEEVLHIKMMDLFKEYLIVGGMPEAVNSYVNERDYNKASRIHMDIIEKCKKDFNACSLKKASKVNKIFDLIPLELDRKYKRYIFTDLDKNFKYDRYENSFDYLFNLGVVFPVYDVSEAIYPLNLFVKDNLFKLFMSDVGILTTMYGTDTKIAVVNQDKNINNGAIYENVLAIELNSHGYKPYYSNSKKYGEVDFIIERNEEVLPIEVKSGKDYEKHNALDKLMSNTAYGIKKSYVLADTNVKVDSNIIYLPIYMIMFIDEAREEQLPTAKIDLSDLVWGE